MKKTPHILVICDGLGIASPSPTNPVNATTMPTLFSWLSTRPHALLDASGASVGLLPGMAGNSQVGHTAIGAGRVITQPIQIIDQLIRNEQLANLEVLKTHLQQLAQSGKTLHLMGLLSDSGNHAHESLAYELIKIATDAGVKRIIVHAFLDGRDTPPRSAAIHLQRLTDCCATSHGIAQIGSISGRFYAMDRVNTPAHLQAMHSLFTQPSERTNTQTWHAVLENAYAQGLSDEFVSPHALLSDCTIHAGDAIIMWNIRADRMRPLMRMLLDQFENQLSWLITAIPYYSSFTVPTLIESPIMHDTLLDALRDARQTVGLFAETEKYAHITYFLNGGRELGNLSELLVIIPSIQQIDIPQHPALRAEVIVDFVELALAKDQCDWYIINFANADMTGHTGDAATTEASLRTLDAALKRLAHLCVDTYGGTLWVTADHGNAEVRWNAQTQQPNAEHTCNPVPFIEITPHNSSTPNQLPLRTLTDIAPYILKKAEIAAPADMTRPSV